MSINVKNISYSYDTYSFQECDKKTLPFKLKALDNVSFTIHENEFVGIIGDNGSGKTTLIKHFNGLLMPDSGEIKVDGLHTKENEVKKLIGMLFQRPQNQIFSETVYEDIIFGLKKDISLKDYIYSVSNINIKSSLFRGQSNQNNLRFLSAYNFTHNIQSKKEIEKRVYESLELVGLDKIILDKNPFKLSGGTIRLVALAGILILKPKYIILDEPITGLDFSFKQQLISILKKIHKCKENKIGIIMVSHNIKDLLELSDTIILMEHGKIKFKGTPSEYLHSIQNPIPIINKLLRDIKKRGFSIQDNIYTVDDAIDEIKSIII